MMDDEQKIDGRIHGPQDEPSEKDSALIRLLYMVVIWLMLQVSLTVMGVMTVVQFILRLINNDTPNPRLADFGESLGIWMAKAGRYLVAASEVKPWPWTELD